MRQLIKRRYQTVLASLTRLRCHLPNKELIILTYHRILPLNHPDLHIMQPGMVTTPETFRKNLQWIQRYFEVVDLSAWINKTDTGSLPDKACAITFDDGWRDTFEFAFPILIEQKVHATVFVVSDLVGTRKSFWPERIARLLWNEGRGVSEKLRRTSEYRWLVGGDKSLVSMSQTPDRHILDRIIRKAKQYPEDLLTDKISSLEEIACSKHPKRRDLMDWNEVKTMKSSGLVDVGSHGKNHVRLNKNLAPERMESEIRDSRNFIGRQLDRCVDLFCYPNGDFTPQAEQLVRTYYAAACTTNRGWNRIGLDKYRLKRIGVHEDIAATKTAFLARLSGWT